MKPVAVLDVTRFFFHFLQDIWHSFGIMNALKLQILLPILVRCILITLDFVVLTAP